MKNIHKFVALMSGAIAALSCSVAMANQTVEARAAIDWGSLKVYSSGILLDRSFYSIVNDPRFGGQTAAAQYPFPPTSHMVPGQNSQAGDNSASFSVSQGRIEAASSALGGAASSLVMAGDNFLLQISTAGTYDVIVPYTVSLTVTGPAVAGETAVGRASASYSLGNGGLGSDGSADQRRQIDLTLAHGTLSQTLTACDYSAFCTPDSNGISIPATSNVIAGEFSFQALVNSPIDGFSMTGNLSANSMSFVSTSPVPEPESYALLLAGLGALGFMSRKRKNS